MLMSLVLLILVSMLQISTKDKLNVLPHVGIIFKESKTELILYLSFSSVVILMNLINVFIGIISRLQVVTISP